MNLVLLIIIAYLVATLWEHYFHRDILHASAKVVRKWQNSNFWLDKMWYHGYYTHHIIHHKKTFQKEYTKQFENKEQKEKLDKYLVDKFGNSEGNRNYGLTVNTIYEYLMFILPLLFLFPILIVLLKLYQIIIFGLVMMLPLLLSKYIHPLLHKEIKNDWFYNNFYIKLIYQTHYIHHKDDSKNFNLLWGGDWIRKSYIAPLNFHKSRSSYPNNDLK